MFDPALAAGDRDDRIDIGCFGRRGIAQGHRKQREPKDVENGKECEDASNHRRSRNALSNADLATRVASRAMAIGNVTSQSASRQLRGAAPASMVALPAPPIMTAMIRPATEPPTIPPIKASIAICRTKSRATWSSV